MADIEYIDGIVLPDGTEVDILWPLKVKIAEQETLLQSLNDALQGLVESVGNAADAKTVSDLFEGINRILSMKADSETVDSLIRVVRNISDDLSGKADASVCDTLQNAIDQINSKADEKADAEAVELLMEHVITLQGIANKNTLDINGLAQRVTELAEQGIDTETITAIITDYIRENGIRDTDTTYSVSIDSGYLVLTPSTGSPQRVKLPATGYVKPAGGIPEEDLSEAVKLKLNRTGGQGETEPTDASQIVYKSTTVEGALNELSEDIGALNDKVAVSATVSDGVATFKNSKGQSLFTMSIPTSSGTVSGMTETQVRALIDTYNFALKSELPASWTETQIRNLITGYGYGNYNKPSGGIPETDLAQAVREKLNNVQGSSGSFTAAQANLLRDALYSMEFSSVEAASQGKAKIDAFIVSIGGTPIESPDTPEQPVVTLSSITASYSGGSVVEGTATSGLAIVVTGNYSDGSSNRVYGFSVSPATISTGSNTLTITYQGKTATVSVTGTAKPAEAPTLQSITATYSGGDVEEGTDATELTGIVVTGHYSDGSTKTETGWTISGNVGVGQNTFTISYSGKTTTINVNGLKKEIPDDGMNKILSVVINTDKAYGVDGYIDKAANYACEPIECEGYAVLKIEAIDKTSYRVPTPWFGFEGGTWNKGTIINEGGSEITSRTFMNAGEYVTIPINNEAKLIGLTSSKASTQSGNPSVRYTMIKEG